jgi:hypothetical protein
MLKAKAKKRRRAKSRRGIASLPTADAQKHAEAYLAWQLMFKNCIAGMNSELDKLLAAAKVGDSFVVLGVTYTIVDNFAAQNLVWKGVNFKRFDLKATK